MRHNDAFGGEGRYLLVTTVGWWHCPQGSWDFHVVGQDSILGRRIVLGGPLDVALHVSQ